MTHYYTYNGLNLIREEWGNNTLLFLYDADGSVIGMQYRNSTYSSGTWDTYLYEKNLQGDIVAVYNTSGTKLVSYTYDPWGRILNTSYHNGGNSTSVVHNNLKYRGYYYDSDLNFYYLATRYYDPFTCRFVTADDPGYLGANGDLVSYNLYAYCSNNPINGFDPTGRWTFSIGGSVSAVLLGGLAYDVYITVDDNWNLGLQISEANVLKKRSGVVLGGVNVGASLKASLSFDADTLYDLEGESYSVSVPIGQYGASISTSDLNDVSGGINSFSLSRGISLFPAVMDLTASKTTTLWSFNIAETAKSIWEEVVSWFS